MWLERGKHTYCLTSSCQFSYCHIACNSSNDGKRDFCCLISCWNGATVVLFVRLWRAGEKSSWENSTVISPCLVVCSAASVHAPLLTCVRWSHSCPPRASRETPPESDCSKRKGGPQHNYLLITSNQMINDRNIKKKQQQKSVNARKQTDTGTCSYLEGSEISRDFDIGAWGNDSAIHTRILTDTNNAWLRPTGISILMIPS